jgi:hypothetical protein
MRKRRVAGAIALLIPVMLLTQAYSCSTANPVTAPHPGTTDVLANSAYNTIVAAKGFLDSEKAQHPECPNAATNVCRLIGQAVGSKDLLIDAASIYCSGPNFLNGGACDPPAAGTSAAAQATAKLQAAIANYNQISADLKTATGGK